MIDIQIWKLKEYNCWNCYWIKDENFNISEKEISEDNYISYSWGTRDSFKKIFSEEIFEIFQKNSYIQISKILNKLKNLKWSIESYWWWDIWKWFIQNCEEAIKKYWDKAYIWHNMYWSNNNFYENIKGEKDR